MKDDQCGRDRRPSADGACTHAEGDRCRVGAAAGVVSQHRAGTPCAMGCGRAAGLVRAACRSGCARLPARGVCRDDGRPASSCGCGRCAGGIPEVVEVYGLAGSIDLSVKIVARDTDDLYRLAGQILEIPGVERTNMSLVMRESSGSARCHCSGRSSATDGRPGSARAGDEFRHGFADLLGDGDGSSRIHVDVHVCETPGGGSNERAVGLLAEEGE